MIDCHTIGNFFPQVKEGRWLCGDSTVTGCDWNYSVTLTFDGDRGIADTSSKGE